MVRPLLLPLACFAMVALIAFAAMWRYDAISGEKVHGVPEQGVTRAEVFSACRDHLREADAEAVAALSRRAEEFADFINERKAGAGPFSREMVSLRGKWAVVKSYLPFTKPSSHEGYVMRKFEEHIFSKEELAMALRRTVEASVRDLKGIENELAVSLRQEILGRSLAPDEIPLAVGEFRAAVDRLVAASQWDAAKSAGRLVVSEVAAQVGTQVLVRLGVSAGILGVGAANSWWSFGAAFGIGLVVDVVWEWIDNPAKDIEREMLAVLEKLSEKASVAMEMEMQRILNQRSRLWDRTVAEMVR